MQTLTGTLPLHCRARLSRGWTLLLVLANNNAKLDTRVYYSNIIKIFFAHLEILQDPCQFIQMLKTIYPKHVYRHFIYEFLNLANQPILLLFQACNWGCVCFALKYNQSTRPAFISLAFKTRHLFSPPSLPPFSFILPLPLDIQTHAETLIFCIPKSPAIFLFNIYMSVSAPKLTAFSGDVQSSFRWAWPKPAVRINHRNFARQHAFHSKARLQERTLMTGALK